MGIEEVIAQVANTGFPIVVAIYLLVRNENKISDLTNCINDLRVSINGLSKIMENLER